MHTLMTLEIIDHSISTLLLVCESIIFVIAFAYLILCVSEQDVGLSWKVLS
jgi:hypothetical protein